MTVFLAWLMMAGAASVPAVPAVQAPLSHAAYESLLDANVRDGYVYYRALREGRAPLDRYIASLDVPAERVAAWPRAEQIAFWVNAYNALVLRTVINAYPIDGDFDGYPSNSIRQVPGAFDGARHPIGSRVLSLDEIETEVLASFDDARIVLLLGRGAVGSRRLRSEAISAGRLETQLTEAVRECAERAACVRVDLVTRQLVVTPLIGWREDAFVRAFGAAAAGKWSGRSPIERAVAAMIYPHLFDREQAFLDEDTFTMRYGEFDWRLNDLTGRRRQP